MRESRRRGSFSLLLPLQTPNLQLSVVTNEQVCRGSRVSGWHCLMSLSASAALHCYKEPGLVMKVELGGS